MKNIMPLYLKDLRGRFSGILFIIMCSAACWLSTTSAPFANEYDAFNDERIQELIDAEAYEEALQIIKYFSQQSNGAAQRWLGIIHDDGLGVIEDNSEAIKFYRLAAEQGDAVGQRLLGYMYDEGDGILEDNVEAMKWYRLAAEQGDADAQGLLGYMYDKGDGIPEDNVEAMKWYRLAAEQGDAVGQSLLGYMYDEGDGIPEDNVAAVKWYRLAAEQGNAGAQRLLAYMYDKADGIPEDNVEAVKWYRLAAEQGDAVGQRQLGAMYDLGEGVLQDYEEAVKWYRLAAEQGDAHAQVMMGLAYDFGEGLEEDNARALFWYEQAAKQEYADGQYYLATMYDYADGVAKDRAKALKLYREAAELGSNLALNRLGWIYHSSQDIDSSERRAEEYFLRAISNGHLKSQVDLGYLYTLEGFSSGKEERGIDLLSKAAQSGSLEALTHLADYFISEQDYLSAERTLFSSSFDFYSEASSSGSAKLWLMNSLRNYYDELQLFDRAIYFSEMSIDFVKSVYGKESVEFLYELMYLTHLHLQTDDPEQVIKILEIELGDGNEFEDVDRGMYAYILANSALAKARLGIQDPTRNIDYARNILQKINDDWGLLQLDLVEAEYLWLNKECEKSQDLLTEIVSISSAYGIGTLSQFMLQFKLLQINVHICNNKHGQAEQLVIDLFEEFNRYSFHSEMLVTTRSKANRSLKRQLLEVALGQYVIGKFSSPAVRDVVFRIMQEISPESNVSQSFLSSMIKAVEPKLSNQVRHNIFDASNDLWGVSNPREIGDVNSVVSEQSLQSRNYNALKTTYASVREHHGELFDLLFPETLSVQDVQALISDDELVFQFYVGDKLDHVYGVAISKRSSLIFQSSIDKHEIESIVVNLRRSVELSETHELPYFDLYEAHRAYTSLLGPADSLLSEAKHLMFISSDFLVSLPFNILVSAPPLPGDDIDSTSYSKAHWLPRSYSTHVLPSPSSLKAIRSLPDLRVSALHSFHGFGDPVLEGRPRSLRGLDIVDVYEGAKVDLGQLRSLPELPDTAEELRRIADYLDAPPSSVFLREDATETAVKSAALDQSNVIAFATHGLISGDLSGLMEPALVMTPPNISTASDDGLLTASEVAQLDLNADIVLLSACNTAAGKELGASGLSGLVGAFIYAGARSLLVTHWPVDSQATTKLTTGMFAAMASDQSIGRAEALRRSMLTMIDDEENPHFAHPAFWAPFSLIGDGQTMN